MKFEIEIGRFKSNPVSFAHAKKFCKDLSQSLALGHSAPLQKVRSSFIKGNSSCFIAPPNKTAHSEEWATGATKSVRGQFI
jgi:hypothetical protein